jgi:hypothetical protein
MLLPFVPIVRTAPGRLASHRHAEFVPHGTNLTQNGGAVDHAPHQFAGSAA